MIIVQLKLNKTGKATKIHALSATHPKSEIPESLDSANYLNFLKNYSLGTQKLLTLLC